MLAETTGDRPKVTKVMSSEDEVARLTIEVTKYWQTVSTDFNLKIFCCKAV